MFLKALLAFLLLPFTFGIALPVILGVIDPWTTQGHFGGIFVVGVGLITLGWCIRDFYVAGKGTLAPWAPPERLVIVGLYKYMRNPMYVGVLVLVLGIVLVYGSPLGIAYWIVLGCGFHIRVVRYEEPWLASTFGAEWQAYRAKVPRWGIGST